MKYFKRPERGLKIVGQVSDRFSELFFLFAFAAFQMGGRVLWVGNSLGQVRSVEVSTVGVNGQI